MHCADAVHLDAQPLEASRNPVVRSLLSVRHDRCFRRRRVARSVLGNEPHQLRLALMDIATEGADL